MDSMNDLIQAVQSGDRQAVTRIAAAQPELAGGRSESGLPLPLMALYYGQSEIADLLAGYAGDLDLFTAAALGKTERAAQILDEEPGRVNAFAGDGFQALGLACFFGRVETARLLIERGAAVNSPSRNPMQVMPLHSAVAAGQLAIAQLLLDAGADPNARQADAFAPLHGAAQNGDAAMLRLLIERGADPRAASAQGKTLLDFARESGKPEAVALIEEVISKR